MTPLDLRLTVEKAEKIIERRENRLKPHTEQQRMNLTKIQNEKISRTVKTHTVGEL